MLKVYREILAGGLLMILCLITLVAPFIATLWMLVWAIYWIKPLIPTPPGW